MKLSTLARKITQLEGKKVQVNIAQIKEILRCINVVYKEYGYDFYLHVKQLLIKEAKHGDE